MVLRLGTVCSFKGGATLSCGQKSERRMATSALAMGRLGVVGYRGKQSSKLTDFRNKQQMGQAGVGRRAADSLLALSPRPLLPVSATKQKHRSPVLRADDDDGDEVTGFASMEDWMQNRPSGFGLMEYDTSLEDRLLAEIEADKEAQAAAKEKRDNESFKKSAKAIPKPVAPPEGVEVYIGNLPKKRNVDRDLRAAFRSVQGLLHVRPIVGGNDKTREPVCKGIAFLTFESNDDAQDFVDRYNGEKIKFGKTEKKVACELAVANSPFKKQVSQKEGMGVPRLGIRESLPKNVSPIASSSSPSAVELLDATEYSNTGREREVVSDLDNVEGEDADLDTLEESEECLLELGQEIWTELEDEDDFELERELEEEDDSKDTGSALSLEESTGLDFVQKRARSSQALRQLDGMAQHHGQGQKTGNHLLEEDDDENSEGEEENEDADLEDAGSKRGFSRTYDNKKAETTVEDKDRRIKQLEFKLKELELRLQMKDLAKSPKEKDVKLTLRSKEKDIEALEKRVLAKARAALQKDPKIKNGNSKLREDRMPSAKKATFSKTKPHSKKDPEPKISKLGSASRLRKRERKIYTDVLSKYSASAT